MAVWAWNLPWGQVAWVEASREPWGGLLAIFGMTPHCWSLLATCLRYTAPRPGSSMCPELPLPCMDMDVDTAAFLSGRLAAPGAAAESGRG